MGTKNKVKKLIGRFNKDTGCKILALPYSINDVVREMQIKIDLNVQNALAIVNVPYFLDEKKLAEVCSSALDTPVARVQFLTSTALHNDLKTGYRSGHLFFASIQARRRAFEACEALEKPIPLVELGLKLPAWHKLIAGRKAVKRPHPVDEAQKEEKMETAKMDTKNEPDEEGWVTVTRKHKFSFRGKINRVAGAEPMNQIADEEMMREEQKKEVDEEPRKKKRRRTK